MFSPDLVSLIKGLCGTQSPTIRLSILLDHIIDNGSDISQEGTQELIRFFREQTNTKQQAGLNAVSARKQGKQKRTGRSYTHPFFVSDYTAHQICQGCKVQIMSNHAFRWKQAEGHYDDYHPLPECWQQHDSKLFAQDTRYQGTLNTGEHL